MTPYRSCFSDYIERFVAYRKASGSWNEPNYGLNIRLFDNFCTDNYPMSVALTQEMVDTWSTKRETETNRSHETRTRVVRLFVEYLRRRDLTDVVPPAKYKSESKTYIPYAFDDDELTRFFHACDSYQPFHFRKKQSLLKKFTVPVFFRLLYSTGMRTTEARLLKKDSVDLVHGIIDIQESKGYDQHYVVMHDSMKSLMVEYDQAIAKLLPMREYFFQTSKGTHYTRDWVQDNFRQFWNKSNGDTTSPVAYDLRHHYAIVNINGWLDDGFEFNDKLQYLSKSMGHRSIEATRYYYSIVPRLSDTLAEKTEAGFNLIVPEVSDEKE